MSTVTYFVAGTDRFGSFRTETVTETLEEFKAWCKEHNVTKNENNIYSNPQGATVVFEDTHPDKIPDWDIDEDWDDEY